MANHRWLLLRDVDVFPPAPHTSVICQRDLSFEIMSGQCERRSEFTIDQFTGRSWGRVGTGRYLKWGSIPPSGMMIAPAKLPEPGSQILICSTILPYFGPKIGKFSNDGNWYVRSDILNDWVAMPSAYIQGWLNLPP